MDEPGLLQFISVCTALASIITLGYYISAILTRSEQFPCNTTFFPLPRAIMYQLGSQAHADALACAEAQHAEAETAQSALVLQPSQDQLRYQIEVHRQAQNHTRTPFRDPTKYQVDGDEYGEDYDDDQPLRLEEHTHAYQLQLAARNPAPDNQESALMLHPQSQMQAKMQVKTQALPVQFREYRDPATPLPPLLPLALPQLTYPRQQQQQALTYPRSQAIITHSAAATTLLQKYQTTATGLLSEAQPTEAYIMYADMVAFAISERDIGFSDTIIHADAADEQTVRRLLASDPDGSMRAGMRRGLWMEEVYAGEDEWEEEERLVAKFKGLMWWFQLDGTEEREGEREVAEVAGGMGEMRLDDGGGRVGAMAMAALGGVLGRVALGES